jgi:bacterioferritin (cytochrome b1)
MVNDAVTESFEDALEKEKYVLDLYLQALNQTKYDAVAAVLNKIMIDEEKHIKNIEEIFKILDKK